MVEFFYYVRSVEMKKPNKLGKVKKGISDLLRLPIPKMGSVP